MRAACVPLALAVSAIALAAPAEAQQPDEAASAAIGDIVVTARRRAEALQSVPISVTAETGAALDARGYTTITDIAKITPSLQFSGGRGGNGGGVAAYIRGVGEEDFIITADPAVGYYVDGVYVARNFAISKDLIDIDRIEVLRGPQGSLFGKNTIGGAISVTTKLPDADRLAFETDLLGGSRATARARASLRLPLGGGWSVGISGLAHITDGWQHLANSHARQGDDRTITGRLVLRHQSQGLDAVLALDALQRRARGAPHSLLDFQPTIFSDLYSALIIPCCTADQGISHTAADLRLSRNDADARNATLTVTADILGGQLKSITAYRWAHAIFGRDGDGQAGADYTGELHDIRNRQISQELQLTNELWNGRVKTLLGLYAFREKSNEHSPLTLAYGLYPALIASGFDPALATQLDFNIDFRNRQTTTNYAVFGNATIALADRLSLDIGGRYTYERKHFSQSSQRIFAGVPLLDGIPFYSLRKSWSAFTPKGVLSYKPARTVLTYVSVSQGFRSGGFNARPTSVPEIGSFNPEKLTSYELGAKATLLGDRLRLNGDVFRNDYRDMQLLVLLDRDGFAVPRIDNAGRAVIQGIEIESVAAPVRWLTLDAAGSYLHGEYEKYVSGGVDLSHRRLRQLPKWFLSAGATLIAPVGDALEARLRVDASYRSAIYVDVENTAELRQPGYALLNAGITFKLLRSGLDISLQGENLTNKRVLQSGFDLRSTFGILEGYYNEPRSFYATIHYRY